MSPTRTNRIAVLQMALRPKKISLKAHVKMPNFTAELDMYTTLYKI